MTYKQFIAMARRKQLAYIRSERVRYGKLDRIRIRLKEPARPRGSESLAYKVKAHKLGLHAMQQDEIAARFAQLAEMEARVDQTHGDTVTMRFAYEMHAEAA